MNKAPVLLLLLLVLAAAGIAVGWPDQDALDLPADVERVLAEELEAPTPDAMAAAATTSGEAPVAGGELPEDLLREEAEGGEASDEGLVVQVWLGKEGQAAPAAEVLFLDDIERRSQGGPFAPHWSEQAEERGKRFVADDGGRVALPPVRREALVVARRPGMFGFTHIGRRHRPIESIVLGPDETVTVRVTDGAGKPVAGIPVGIVQQLPVRQQQETNRAQLQEMMAQLQRTQGLSVQNPEFAQRAGLRIQVLQGRMQMVEAELRQNQRGPRPQRPEAQATEPPRTRPEQRAQRETDGKGLAVFRHFQLCRQEAEDWWPAEQRDRFAAVLLMPLAEPPLGAFAGRPVPTATIELRLPALGSVALRPIDGNGRPFAHPVLATLRVLGDDGAPWSRVHLRAEQDQGQIVFPYVGLGLQLLANCRLDDNDFRWQLGPFPGPGEPGQRVTVDLVIAPDASMLAGRLLSPDGEPLGGARATFLVTSPRGRLEGEEVRLDPTGRFHLPCNPGRGHTGPLALQIRHEERTIDVIESDGKTATAIHEQTNGLLLPLPPLTERTVTELGDLRLLPLPALAHGIVVDDRGQPVAGAQLQLQGERVTGRDGGERAFQEEAFVGTRSGGDGRFALLASPQPGRWRLQVRAPGHFPWQSPDLRPGQELRIVLPRQARLVAQLLRPRWLQSSRVQARLVSAIDPRRVRDEPLRDFRGKSHVFFDWVEPGVYELTLSTPDFPEPFLRVPGIVVAPGQMEEHPLLRGIDLGALLYRFDVVAVDEHGQHVTPDRPLLVRVERPNGEIAHVGMAWQKSRVQFVSTNPMSAVVPLASGYVAAPGTLSAGRSELLFRSIAPVELKLPGLAALCSGLEVQIVLQRLEDKDLPKELLSFNDSSKQTAGSYGRARFTAAALGADDMARVAVGGGGRHRVIARLGERQRGGRPGTVALGNVAIELRPGAVPQQITVRYDRAAVEKALAAHAQQAEAKRK
jgi:hypothetical protein